MGRIIGSTTRDIAIFDPRFNWNWRRIQYCRRKYRNDAHLNSYKGEILVSWFDGLAAVVALSHLWVLHGTAVFVVDRCRYWAPLPLAWPTWRLAAAAPVAETSHHPFRATVRLCLVKGLAVTSQNFFQCTGPCICAPGALLRLGRWHSWVELCWRKIAPHILQAVVYGWICLVHRQSLEVIEVMMLSTPEFGNWCLDLTFLSFSYLSLVPLWSLLTPQLFFVT